MMAFPLHSTSYTTGSYEEEAGFSYTLSAGPEAWQYHNFPYSLQEVGTHLTETSPPFLPLYDTAPPMNVPRPTATASFDYGQRRLSTQGFGVPDLSLLTDHGSLPIDEASPLTTVTDAGSILAISPQDFRSPEQRSLVRESSLSPASVRRSFSVQATAPLREWFDRNTNDPYPSKETKEYLAQQAGLTFRQVNNWFINARKRMLPRTNEPVLLHTPMTSSPAMSAISSHENLHNNPTLGGHFRGLSPVAGPEFHFHQPTWLSPITLAPSTRHNGTITPTSTTSLHPPDCTGPEYVLSSTPFMNSYEDSVQHTPRTQSGPIGPLSSLAGPLATSTSEVLPVVRQQRRGVRRSSRALPPTSNGGASRKMSNSSSDKDQSDDGRKRKSSEIFQCTFTNCGKSFSSKTWKRHEETKHLPRFQWTCMATSFLVPAPPSPQTTPNPLANPFLPHTTPIAPRMMCAFCGERDPDRVNHPRECPHRIADCLSRPEPERTFSRKDHLFQHLRNFHRMTPPDGSFGAQWKNRVDHAGRSWPCGFCGERLGSWERRARHLRGHFREGARVETDWDERRARPAHSLSL